MRQTMMGVASLLIACCLHAQTTVNIWPGAAPGTEHATQPEQVVRDTPVGTVVLGVTTPTLTAYLPDRAKATGTSVIIAPGGYCVALAIDAEGNDVARSLQQRGIAAFVLKYRLKEKKQQGIPQDLDMDAACKNGIADAIQAIKQIRQRAARWNISPTRVGVLGFSAGGMVASGALLQPDAAARPDFAALIYGAPFGVMPAIPPKLPPVFMAWAQDDDVARAPVVKFYDTLMAAGQKPEVHIYSGGGHGFGMRRQGTSSDHWIDDFDAWLAAQGWTKQPARKTKHGDRATGEENGTEEVKPKVAARRIERPGDLASSAPDGIRATLADRSGQASQLMTSVVGYGFRGQGQERAASWCGPQRVSIRSPTHEGARIIVDSATGPDPLTSRAAAPARAPVQSAIRCPRAGGPGWRDG